MAIEKSPRQIIVERLNGEICLATTGDLQRAVQFLEGAREIRRGKTGHRKASRQAMKESARRKVDRPISW